MFLRIQKVISDLLTLIKKKYEAKVPKDTYAKLKFTDFLIELNSSEI